MPDTRNFIGIASSRGEGKYGDLDEQIVPLSLK
jgi:hypothetical protein